MIRPRKTVEEMPRYDPPLEGRRDKLRLDFNENTQGPSPKALEVLRNATPEMLSTYPEYADAYGFFARHWGVDISNILATNGTDEAIRIIFNTFINEGDVVVLPAPSYALFELESVLFGADIR
ncbi:MAG TPA: aminotransferase class I/II-fold pyridoxal phosphate-dependent enzyme, partial [Methanomicrobia archaeon]|nr:aminotransferase class I/II-fold pyridoxal phosphate-dependent enzyme [Methanomicrobia archaeon]